MLRGYSSEAVYLLIIQIAPALLPVFKSSIFPKITRLAVKHGFAKKGADNMFHRFSPRYHLHLWKMGDEEYIAHYVVHKVSGF